MLKTGTGSVSWVAYPGVRDWHSLNFIQWLYLAIPLPKYEPAAAPRPEAIGLPAPSS